jgi:hypothetical protein
MLIDGITPADLQVFADDDGHGGLHGMFERAESRAGRNELRRRLPAPESEPGALTELQDAVRFLARTLQLALLGQDLLYPVERYLGSNIDLGPSRPRWLEWPNELWLRLREAELCRKLKESWRGHERPTRLGGRVRRGTRRAVPGGQEQLLGRHHEAQSPRDADRPEQTAQAALLNM